MRLARRKHVGAVERWEAEGGNQRGEEAAERELEARSSQNGAKIPEESESRKPERDDSVKGRTP